VKGEDRQEEEKVEDKHKERVRRMDREQGKKDKQ
jgi:hypothetical protein